jgi:Spy/CpxP family protein refolding chaperone
MLHIRPALLAITFGASMAATAVLAADPVPVLNKMPNAGENHAPVINGVQPNGIPVPNTNPLNLNADQQKEAKGLRKEQADHFQVINGLERQLEALSSAEVFDNEKAQNIAKQIADATEAHLVLHAKNTHHFYNTLSAEQKKQFQAFEDRRHKMQDNMKNRSLMRPPVGAKMGKPNSASGTAPSE